MSFSTTTLLVPLIDLKQSPNRKKTNQHQTISSNKTSFNDNSSIITLKKVNANKKTNFSSSSLNQNSSLYQSMKIKKTKSKIFLSPITNPKISRIPMNKIAKNILLNKQNNSMIKAPTTNKQNKSRQKVFLLQKNNYTKSYLPNHTTFNIFGGNGANGGGLEISMNHLQIMKIHKEIHECIIKVNKHLKENNSCDIKILGNLIKNYFVTLKKINYCNNLENIFTNGKKLNVFYSKFTKYQILIYTILFIGIQFLTNDDFNNLISNEFFTLFNEFSVSFCNFCANYIFSHFSTNNNNFCSLNANMFGEMNDIENLTKYYIKKYGKNQKTKPEHLLLSVSKSIEKCFQNLKIYLNFTLKFSKIKPYSDPLEEILLGSFSLKNIIILITNHLLYSELNPSISTIHINIAQNTVTENKVNDCTLESKIPFLPKINSDKFKYSLVVDLDETLIHSFIVNEIHHSFFIRPFCFEFLNELSSIYEIIIFTAGTKDYADSILDQLDKKNNIIRHRLYRDHLTYGKDNKSILKDLSKLGRDLTRTIIVDNIEENYTLQKDNGILIQTWNGNFNDRELFDIKNFLKETAIILDNCEERGDIRKVIRGVNKELKNKRKERPYKDINVSCVMEL